MTHPPYYPPGPPPPRKSNAAKYIAVTVGVFLLLCLGGIAVTAIVGPPTEPAPTVAAQDDANRRAASTSASSSPAPSPAAASSSPAKPTKGVPKPPEAILLSDGVYTVGEDIPAGRYKVDERADDTCYWSLTRRGDLVDNFFGGGFPSFTVRAGDEIEVEGCPNFRKIK